MAKGKIREILQLAGPVLPIVTIERPEDALELAQALSAGGIEVLEITLRSAAALQAVSLIRQHLPHMTVGVGTLTSGQQLQQALAAGAQFFVSPGLSLQLAALCQEQELAYLPGIITPSEAMQAMELGYDCLKLFPANAIDSLQLLDSLQAPLPQLGFCPTGGINQNNLASFLQRPNVVCCGGSWLAPQHLIDSKNWSKITDLAAQAKLVCETAR